MALNKYMHPRNIYRIPPDFEKLSKVYADFSRIAKKDGTGKVTIDFKDPHSLRILTRCLLKSDFNLDVEIPEDRLVPTLPLRLNYILWIEDLMNAIQRNSDICGIDIGTGACAVYPLLAAAKNKWSMLATETDTESLQKAQENIQRNKLQQLIQVRDNKSSKLIENLFTEETNDVFDFCMCNPPFYSNLQELYESRSPARLPPKNGFTGSPQELITEGGELKFCRTLIEESKRCKNKVLIFTTMVGHKYNVSELLLDLKAEGIKHTHTEFCQGRVTRWGMAWTYQDHDLHSLVPPRDKPRKKTVPITHELPPIPNCEYNLENAYNKIKTILDSLQIEQKTLNKCGNRISLDILARENTWSNQRRKRRLLKRLEATDAKKPKLNNSDNIESITNSEQKSDVNKTISDAGKTIENRETKDETKDVNRSEINMHEIDNKTKKSNDTIDSKAKSFEVMSINGETSTTNAANAGNKKLTENITNGKTEISANTEPLIHAFMKLYKKDKTIQLDIELMNGIGGKESVYQIVQYIKNNWN